MEFQMLQIYPIPATEHYSNLLSARIKQADPYHN